MKNVTKLLALVMALCMVLGVVPSMAEVVDSPVAQEIYPKAFLMYADGAWVNQVWNPGERPEGIQVTEADITGEGDYTVALDFTGTADGAAAGLAFAALGIEDGENSFPGWKLRINEIRVNGAPISFVKGYTSSDDGIVTRMNIFNEWVSELPEDARSFDGNVEDASPKMVDAADFESVQTIEVDFTYMKNGIDTAYIMYADSAWAAQYWLDGNAYDGVVATNATVTGAGDYTVGLDFSGTANGKATGIAFTALGIKHGENLFPGMMIQINDVRINGESVAFTKGYTSSDDGIETRMNIFNEWVPEVNTEDPTVRSFDGNLDGASPRIIEKDAFAEVVTIEIDFTLIPKSDVAFLMFADTTWAVSAWNAGEYAETNAVKLEAPGTYTLSLAFPEAVAGFEFLAVGIANGENTFPGYFIDVTEIKVNGEAIEIGKDYTTTDDGVVTRSNIVNKWVTEVPEEARIADGDLEGAAPVIVAEDALANVETLDVTFDFIYGEPPKAAAPEMTQEELDAALAADYNAYIAVQSESYIFRNDWYDANYGLNSENPEFFYRLTGWDAENNAVDYGGTFVDAVITGNGTYTVTMTTGDHGFGVDTLLRYFRVSTDIPSAIYGEGKVQITDCKVKIGDGKTQDALVVRTEADYVEIVVRDEYNKVEPAFSYMPGANTLVTFTFTVSGLAD